MKVAKKNLRSAQRQQEACLRKNRYDDIMSAKEGNQKLFHKLVADQRKDGTVILLFTHHALEFQHSCLVEEFTHSIPGRRRSLFVNQ
jgi:hypothetical protein